ncbi:MAG: S-layer homology domain-containing protein [Caldilineaceae bacterium SB0662_bin_9]|uniref:S-layer homology domain-containing protein n=1 Tax=Caldilineaceae bacterium SB0662_bin_9 TaxID=2605258 RepID=A0A6B1DXJ2_9CHLR|nr:S-layer homology domain-containing protein [Caldilineaceae bacterium SB0662_bin_9]
MFASLSRFRRQVAVLAVLSMVASVLVVAPAVAADPKPSRTATFSACVGDAAESADFEDVPANHTNAGDIDCIAYYGITMGTGDGSTYSPSMSVTREHMALFLTRLAARVGIEMASNPDDAGFTDIGDLSTESQTAINQLADLGITQGTGDGTTYSPAGSVTRGQMALFIDRLMDQMTPYGGAKSADAHTPSDVDDLRKDDVGSPFTDLGSATKEAFDAITALYELGVASGINDTHYGPAQSITRAAMAGFMAGVMGHSNLRPAGLSIQASVPSTFGTNEGSVVASVRDDGFAAVADQTVEIFSSADGAFDEDGVCKTATGTCTWNDGQGEELTDEDGNIVIDGGALRGETRVYYAWIGTEDDEKFDVDETDHVSVSVVSKNEELALKVTTSINENADGETVDLDRGGSVTVTVQLVDTAADGAENVARSGIEISVGVKQETDPDSDSTTANTVVYDNRAVTTLTTDEDGKATFVVDAPKDADDKNDVQIGDDVDGSPADAASNLENRTDTITFTYKQVDGRAGSADAVEIMIHWKEDNPVTTSASGSVPTYVIGDKDGDLAITASLTLYDQYGNGIREGGVGQQATISIGGDEDNVNVNRNGVATRRRVIERTATALNASGTPIPIAYTERPTVGGATQDDVTEITKTAKQAADTTVQVVTRANDDDVGSVEVNSIDTKKSEFLARDDPENTSVTAGNSDLVYNYDSGDTFVNGLPNGDSQGELLTLEEFEDMLDDYADGGQRARVDVIVYKPDGNSIFRVTIRSAPPSS